METRETWLERVSKGSPARGMIVVERQQVVEKGLPYFKRVVGTTTAWRLVAGGVAGATEKMRRGSNSREAGGGGAGGTGEGVREPGQVGAA